MGKAHLYGQLVLFVVAIGPHLLADKIRSIIHDIFWKPTTNTKNVIVIGGSFAGFYTAQRLTQTLPSGYKVILIEKNNRLHHVFHFPRFSVMKGKEHLAFIPYQGLEDRAVKGIFERIQGTVERVEEGRVVLANGNTVVFEYCVIATGAKQAFPARLESTTTDEACRELRQAQANIEHANTVAIVGAGAVGVELATDIKAYYPKKDVTIISSREYILPGFGHRLREHALTAVTNAGIDVILEQRPKLLDIEGEGEGQILSFTDGSRRAFDLVIACTGQTPNSSVIKSLSPRAISEDSGRILVYPTLQVKEPGLLNIFALGDVAETKGPRMARAAYFQSRVVAKNISIMINGGQNLRDYVPRSEIEGSIKLTLGKTEAAIYTENFNGDSLLWTVDGSEDLDIEKAWWMYGVKLNKEEEDRTDAKIPM